MFEGNTRRYGDEKNKLMLSTFLGLCLLAIVLFGISNSNIKAKKLSNKQQIKNIVNHYFTDFYDSLVTYKLPANTEDYIENNENTYLYKKILEFDSKSSKNIGSGFHDYKLKTKYKKLKIFKNKAEVKLLLTVDYHYKEAKDMDSAYYNIKYDFKLNKKDGKWKIYFIDTNNENYEYFKSEVQQRKKVLKRIKTRSNADPVRQSIDQTCEEMTDSSETQNEELKNLTETVDENRQTPEFRSVSKSYSWKNGIDYALTYAEKKRIFYVVPNENDCTNFISQCVWAGYGGYVKGDKKKTKSNMKNKVRMVSGVWQGGEGGGTGNWESVKSFWSYAIKDKTYGPKGKGYNNNKLVRTLTNISFGDVIQSKNNKTKNDYKHSAYVSSIEKRLTYVSQHNRRRRSLSSWINYNGGPGKCYMRRIHFSSAKFSK